MKKQGAVYLKLLSISLAGLTLLFLLLRFCGGREDYRLQEVIYCEVGDGYPVSGFVVREEQLLLSSSKDSLRYTAAEGQWLRGGQSYALGSCCTASTAPAAVLCAGQSGYFSQNADGYTGLLSYEVLQRLSPRDFAALQLNQTLLPEEAVGKLVHGQVWYYAVLLPMGYREGQAYRLTFSELGQTITMTLSHLSPAREGIQLGVFSCGQNMQEILSHRRLEAVIQGQQLSGLEVPKATLYHLEGETGVYVLVGQQAKWKTITILRDLGETVLAEYTPADLRSLRIEDVLILTTQEIENGKVIR